MLQLINSMKVMKFISDFFFVADWVYSTDCAILPKIPESIHSLVMLSAFYCGLLECNLINVEFCSSHTEVV